MRNLFVLRSLCLLALLAPGLVRGEAMLQYFNTSWQELTAKIPELAEVGYESLWLPPPTKASGGLSVGYDLWDRFDLGSKNQRNTVRTRYGTEEELQRLIATAHRFGIRIYFDNIMNHNAFDVPGFNEFTPIDVYPGFVAEDFHLRVTEDGFYRKWDNTRDWNDAWQVQHLGLADLIDIAHEYPNQNHGQAEGDWLPKKYVGVRQPFNPEYYLDLDLQVGTDHWGNPVFTFGNKESYTDIGWGPSNTGAGNGRFDWDDSNGNGQHDFGETSEPFVDLGLFPEEPLRTQGAGDGIYNMGNPIAEDVNQLLIRAARWQLDRTYADGYRLDAVKHVPDWFFGQQSGDKNPSGAGYLGQSQEQFNLTRGFSDWDNHRDTVFNTELPRDDAMMFGEHLGEPPGYGGYVDAGMRLVDNELRSYLNGNLAFGSINGFDSPGTGGFGDSVAVMHAQSHDSDYVTKRDLQHAIYFTRTGLPLVYTDGNFQAETLGESGGAFPRHSNTAFLGQFGNQNIPNSVFLHNHFARGYQKGIWSSDNVAVWERIDNRVDGANEGEWATALFLFNKDGGSGRGYTGATSFPATKFGADTYLKNYSTFGGGFPVWASDLNSVIVPPDGYFAFSYHLPESADGWALAGGEPISFYQDGQIVSDTLAYERRDGPDGDPGFNPYGVSDTNTTDYAYTWTVPRITSGTNLSFRVRTDGSTENVHIKLNGGIDLNGISHAGGDPRRLPTCPVLRHGRRV